MTAFEDFVNLELPQRPVMLLSGDVGYTGDPNGGGAPAILQGAPAGTFFLDESSTILWRKFAVGATSWVESAGIDPQTATVGAITTTINPDSGAAAPRPSAGTVFQNQAQTDAFLAANSATSFTRPADFYDFLPSFIQHAIVMNCFNVCRPDPGVSGFDAFNMKTKNIIGDGKLTIAGDPNTANWTQVHAGGTVQAHEASGAAFNPTITFPAATFPNDGSLKGFFLVLSNGAAPMIIHDHDDAVLSLTLLPSVLPTNGVTTATIRRPSTIFRNSQDDATAANFGTLNIAGNGLTSDFGQITVQDIAIEPLGGFSNTVTMGTARQTWNRVLINKRDGPGVFFANSIAVFDEASVNMNSVSHIAAENTGSTSSAVVSTAKTNFQTFNCYFQGGSGGLAMQGEVFLNMSVIDGVGNATIAGSGAVAIVGGTLDSQRFSGFQPGPNLTIRGTVANVAGIHSNNSQLFRFPTDVAVEFANCVGPCVRAGSRTTMDLTGAPGGLIDGGGNTDVGVDITGPYTFVMVDANTDVTGTNGDVRDADAVVRTWGTVRASGPFTDGRFNIVDG